MSSGSVTTPFDLGSGSHSMQMGGGAAYAFTNFLSAQGQATYYDQYYYDRSYTGTYLSGTVNYSRRLWNMFSFSAGVVDSNNGQGDNAVGFIGNVNYFHRIEGWGDFRFVQLRAERSVGFNHVYDFFLQLHGPDTPPSGIWLGLVSGL